MDKILLAASVLFFFAVFFYKRISPLSLYTLFGLEMVFYFVFPLFLSFDMVPKGLFTGYPLNYDKEVQFYFFLFNAGAMFVFSAVYLFFYKRRKAGDWFLPLQDFAPRLLKYRQPMFILMVIINVIVLYLSIKYPYTKMTWWSHSINANLRNVILSLFLFYMLLRPNKWKLGLIFFLFALSTFVYGGRAYLIILGASLFYYWFDVKILNLKQIMVVFLASIVFLTSVGLLRNGLLLNPAMALRYSVMPMYTEGVFSSYPGFALIDKWRHDEIKYHTYFGSYLIDPLMIFVPQFVFVKEGATKYSFNVLGKWEDDHGGREHIAPQGGYYYMAEAMEALSVPGIFIVVFFFALLCLGIEKLKYAGIFGKYVYYSFVGTVGVGFVSDQFAWCMRSFGMNLEVLIFFLVMFELFTLGRMSGAKPAPLKEKTA
jgi:hypothetical protein